MPVVIRMKRTGRRNRPCFRISVADARAPRDGRTLDSLGLYDPVCKDADSQTTLDVERARHWLSNGAQPSDTVRSIFKRMGVFEEMDTEKKKRDRSGRKATTKTGERRSADKAARAVGKEARREERLAAKLRENLRRRKGQAREIRESDDHPLSKGDAGS